MLIAPEGYLGNQFHPYRKGSLGHALNPPPGNPPSFGGSTNPGKKSFYEIFFIMMLKVNLEECIIKRVLEPVADSP